MPGPQRDPRPPQPRADLGALEGFGPGLTVLVQRGRGICVCWHVHAGVPLKGGAGPRSSHWRADGGAGPEHPPCAPLASPG